MTGLLRWNPHRARITSPGPVGGIVRQHVSTGSRRLGPTTRDRVGRIERVRACTRGEITMSRLARPAVRQRARLASLVAPGQPFGLGWQGVPGLSHYCRSEPRRQADTELDLLGSAEQRPARGDGEGPEQNDNLIPGGRA